MSEAVILTSVRSGGRAREPDAVSKSKAANCSTVCGLALAEQPLEPERTGAAPAAAAVRTAAPQAVMGIWMWDAEQLMLQTV